MSAFEVLREKPPEANTMDTINLLKIGTLQRITVIVPKTELLWFYNTVMRPENEDFMANSKNPNQTAPLIWVCTISFRPICPNTLTVYARPETDGFDIGARKTNCWTEAELQIKLALAIFRKKILRKHITPCSITHIAEGA